MSNQKAKFFAQYWGCNVLYVGGVGFQRVGFGRWNLRHPDFFIELTPLSQISDEDLLKISRMNFLNSDIRNVGANEFSFWYDVRGANKGRWFHKSDYWGNLNTQQSDYLRSKGYALPWLGISVEEQIRRGWVKLKIENNEKTT